VGAERYIDGLWEQTIWPVVKDCNLAHVVDLAAGHGRNTRKLLEVAGEVVVLDIHSNYTAGTMNWLANPSSRNFMSKELFAHYAFKEGFQVVHQQVCGWGGIDDLDCITLVELPL
jgi:hypothetical protein